ncbi:TIGR03618 family F420-dependent PPOX class oxidoreductase [Asanoa sp. NPDC049573]|uniref:TIGR03618 family F420-dependent PPOX class oxidoreductase n=1 Tax=Asanoa sp. NPDC049573 TaxID=3155396 RepID=UPI0034368475
MTTLPDDVIRLLDEPCTAHLATILPDGSPHSVPVWVGREGPHIAFLTSPGSRKARNIERDPRVAISLTRRERPNDMAFLRGRVVEVVDGDRGWEIIDRLSQKYLGGPYPLRTDRAAYLIEVDHAGAMSF